MAHSIRQESKIFYTIYNIVYGIIYDFMNDIGEIDEIKQPKHGDLRIPADLSGIQMFDFEQMQQNMRLHRILSTYQSFSSHIRAYQHV